MFVVANASVHIFLINGVMMERLKLTILKASSFLSGVAFMSFLKHCVKVQSSGWNLR